MNYILSIRINPNINKFQFTIHCAEGESQNVGGEAKKGSEIEVGDKEKEEKMKKILQRQLEDAKGQSKLDSV
jgi:hypothetical protein